MKRVLFLMLAMACTFTGFSQNLFEETNNPAGTADSKRLINPAKARLLEVNFDDLKSFLNEAPHQNNYKAKDSPFQFVVPMPDGTNEIFTIVESITMEPKLADKFQEIKTFSGQGVTNPSSTLVLDYTPNGFHAMVLEAGRTAYIDPYFFNETQYYQSYWKSDFYASTNKVFDEIPPIIQDIEIDINKYDNGVDTKYKKPRHDKPILNFGKMASSGTNLRTYRLALAGTGEYTSFHGGTVGDGMAAMVTSMARVNGVYQRDVAITMVMVPNNDLLVYTNGGTDPYSNGNGGAMLGQNISNCNSVIGSANYDIGHVFSTGGGGVAYLGVPCTNNKAGGVTGQSSPIGDPFDIDYVCHEMGHQFGGNHTQNNSCNRSTNAAYEPGSASTIMGYAGICAPNLQSNSDDHFHNHSYNEIVNYSTNSSGNNCPVIDPTGNTIPTLDAGLTGTTIPISTPFELTAISTDADGDIVTYNWEQYNLGPATAGGDSDLTNPSGNQPIFRSWPSTLEPTRVFPRISDLVNNTTVIGELLPTYGRNLTFRCTVRDNQAGAGAVNDDQVSFTVSGSAGPFVVNYPNTGLTFTGNTIETVTWDVANTNAAPVNCSNVDIYLSTDGGFTYPILLQANTPNDGSQGVLIPVLETTTARIKVKASNNIFFDISNTNFAITGSVSSNDYDATVSSVIFPVGDLCLNSFVPEIVIGNAGAVDLTSVTINYNVDGGTNMVYNWTGLLTLGQTETILLPALITADGPHTFNVTSVNPNGVADENTANDSASSVFSTTSNPGCTDPAASNYDSTAGCDDGSCIFPCVDVTISIDTDCWGGEVSWVLTDATGTIIDEINSGTLGNQSNFTWTNCLPVGCYDWTISDTFGDGLAGIASGCPVDGNYTLTDANGTVLVQMGNSNYGSSITHNFCVSISDLGCVDTAACNYNPSATTDDGSCTYPGCTDVSACNYDSTAGCDDGSCQASGCADSTACNFDPAAFCDDGTCVFGPTNDVCSGAIALSTGVNSVTNTGACIDEGYAVPGGNCNGTLTWCTQNGIEGDVFYSFTTPASPTVVNLITSFDGTGTWIDTQMAVFDGCGGALVGANDDGGTDLYMSQLTFDCGVLAANTTYVVLLDGYAGNSGTCNLTLSFDSSTCGSAGCTDPLACNYDPTATVDDGSCLSNDACGNCGGTDTAGCTDPFACNYDATASCDDGSCLANDECGNCGGTDTAGCTDPFACNYDATADCDDGSCLANDACGNCGGTDTAGCTDPFACNYDATADCDDGSCLADDACGNCGGTDTAGCTDPLACNYDATADCDDGSCLANDACGNCGGTDTAGCTDPLACNYDATADCDDGSCLANDECGNCGGTDTAGCTDPLACNYDATADCDDGSCLADDACGNCGGTDTAGCTDPLACNYDATADCDDGSCLANDACGNCGGTDTAGCTDPLACNYDATADCDDGSCLANDECGNCGGTDTAGCTDPLACNYDATADCDDGSCLANDACGNCGGTDTAGCTDPLACNYDATAGCDDGSCLANDACGNCGGTDTAGCTDPLACNYDATAGCDDGSCLANDACGNCGGTDTAGCTDPLACNYDATAGCDDGTCVLPDGCTDIAACNYDSLAQCDDGSCTYAPCGTCIGDANGDGFVNILDLVSVSSNFGCTSGCLANGDADFDGVVNVLDLIAVSSNFGNICP